ncbi:MAG: hypothetical protein PHE09_01050 [Oscillospiraceae bacterium]|nr:hypothetical protein [Oscillospiraceae bacterium]
MSRKEKKAAKEKQSTRQLLAIDGITEHSLQTAHGELVFFSIKPTNISVLSDASVAARIYALMTVLKGMTELEMLCINSRENFEDNKRYLKERIEAESLAPIRKLLEQDSSNLDRLQVQMATAREFLIVIRLKNEKEAEVFPYLSRIEKSLRDAGFTVRRADSTDIKRLLGVYYEQNVTTEVYEDFDGERWVILGE